MRVEARRHPLRGGAAGPYLPFMTTTRNTPDNDAVAVEDDLVDLGRRLAIRTRAEQGLPERVEDAEVLDVFTDLAVCPLGRAASQD